MKWGTVLEIFSATLLIVFAAAACLNPAASNPLPVFPGAQGFGTATKAGRGGQIIRVTNLNDSGSGSLRAALEASGARTVVFEVSGRINLKSNLSISNPYVTVAGQTAPAPGIMITGQTFIIRTHDVLIQHLSIRIGDEGTSSASDVIQITGTGAYNIVLDHISATWGRDEVVGIGYGIKDITFSNCIISEGLYGGSLGLSGYGVLLADDSTRISLIGNLVSHHAERLPRIQTSSILLANNVFYDKGGKDFSGIGMSKTDIRKPSYLSAVGNLFLDGPSGEPGRALVEVSIMPGSAIYQRDNVYPSGSVYNGKYGVNAPPANTWIEGFTYMKDPAAIKASVIQNVGPRPAGRDPVDRRIVGNLVNGTGRLISSQRDVGGFPALAQNRAAFNAGTNPNGDDDGDGYTNLEEILHQRATKVESRE